MYFFCDNDTIATSKHMLIKRACREHLIYLVSYEREDKTQSVAFIVRSFSCVSKTEKKRNNHELISL